MSDLHPQLALKLQAPWRHSANITLHDTNDLTHPVSALMVGTPGDLKVDMAGGETLIIPSAVVTAFPLLKISVTRIYTTGTGASNVFAVW